MDCPGMLLFISQWLPVTDIKTSPKQGPIVYCTLCNGEIDNFTVFCGSEKILRSTLVTSAIRCVSKSSLDGRSEWIVNL